MSVSDDPCILPVCETAVLHALTTVGKRIARNSQRVRQQLDIPWWEVHTLQPGTDGLVRRSRADMRPIIEHAIRINTVHDQPGLVADVVDSYVRDLVVTGKPHDSMQLADRLKAHI